MSTSVPVGTIDCHNLSFIVKHSHIIVISWICPSATRWENGSAVCGAVIGCAVQYVHSALPDSMNFFSLDCLVCV